MADEIKQLRVKRGCLKATITRIECFVVDSVRFQSAGVSKLEARRDKLVSAFIEYENITVEILTLDSEDKEEIDSVESKYYFLLALLNDSLKGNSVQNDST